MILYIDFDLVEPNESGAHMRHRPCRPISRRRAGENIRVQARRIGHVVLQFGERQNERPGRRQAIGADRFGKLLTFQNSIKF
jgi:hypothetical protein